MRKSIIHILLLSFLLQSCYSYRVIDKNSKLAIGKKYKVKQLNKYEKVRLLSITDTTIIVSNNKNSQNTIDLNDIKIIKKRHFSVTKTVLLPIGIVIVGVGTIIAVDGSHFTPFTQ
jgi:hypothetical protein